jgi:hypothetical protein
VRTEIGSDWPWVSRFSCGQPVVIQNTSDGDRLVVDSNLNGNGKERITIHGVDFLVVVVNTPKVIELGWSVR